MVVEIHKYQQEAPDYVRVSPREGVLNTEIGRERLIEEIKTNVDVICANQAENGLFPAVNLARETTPAEEAYDSQHHYDEHWVRDGSIVAKGLYKTATRGRSITELRDSSYKAGEALGRYISGTLDIVSNDPWDRAFEQKIKHHSYVAEDGQIVRFTKRTSDAPPVHFKMDGQMCDVEWAQNQPDSWGVLLNVAGNAMKRGLVDMTDAQRATLKKIGNYLIEAKAEMFDCSSMWEELEVHKPPPLSSALMVAQGLEATADLFDQNYKDRASMAVDRIHRFAKKEFPHEISGPVGHYGKYDLATLVALSLQSADSRYSLDTYLEASNHELGNGHGKIRYVGDAYQGAVDYIDGQAVVRQEAVWFMSMPLEAIERFKNYQTQMRMGRVEEAQITKEKAFSTLKNALAVGDHYGYYPELWTEIDGGFKPNPNDLLWNRALMLNASAMALEAIGAQKGY